MYKLDTGVEMPDGFDLDDLEEITYLAHIAFCAEQEEVWGNCNGFISLDMVRHVLLVMEKPSLSRILLQSFDKRIRALERFAEIYALGETVTSLENDIAILDGRLKEMGL